MFLLLAAFAFLSPEFTCSGEGVETNGMPAPLIEPPSHWQMNEYCRQRKIGEQDFYIASQASWAYSGDTYKNMQSLGLERILLPGGFSISVFDPSLQKTADQQRLIDLFLKNRWPFITNEGHAARENARPVTEEAKKAAGELWLGDGHTEYNYRFDFLLPAVRGEKTTWLNDPYRIEYTRKNAMPLLEKELPFFREKNHKWTYSEYYKLSKIQQDVIFSEIGVENAMPWAMGELGFYYLASLQGNRAVGTKSQNPLAFARCRGAMRQFGGNKFLAVYQAHEPMSLFSSHFQHSRFMEQQGYPHSHGRIFLYEPYLSGVDYQLNEAFPGSLMLDVEKDGHCERSPLGHLFTEFVDFVQRHPERGITYAPVALMHDWERTAPSGFMGTTYGTYLPFEDCDHMNLGIYNLLFPETPEGPMYSYFCTTPFGDIFDQIKPNVPGKGVDPKALENYRILFALGGLNINQDLAGKLEKYVSNGGVLVVNALDAENHFSADFLGVDLLPITFDADETVCTVCGKKTGEPLFTCRAMKLRKGADAVVTAKDRAVVSRNKYGKGMVFVIGAEYMIAKEGKKMPGRNWSSKQLLNFTGDFMGHLTAGLLPVDVIIPEKSRSSLKYTVSKKGNGWLVTLINYSYDRDPVEIVKYGTAAVDAISPPAKIPVRLVCKFPVADALEWFENKDVPYTMENSHAVIDTHIASGEMKVIELQPEKIVLKPVECYVNYALNRPVTTTSEVKGHEGKHLVDGKTERSNGWWSSEIVRGREHALPQSATVDLQEKRIISHVEVLFTHTTNRELLAKYTTPRYVQFYVETSLDGTAWETVFDERKSMKHSVGWPLERWFEPHPARYVRLTVTYESLSKGAMVVEMKVMGEQKEQVEQKRVSAIPPWEVQYPPSVKSALQQDILYLSEMEPAKPPVIGWMPPGAIWGNLNGSVILMTSIDGDGRSYGNSLYAEAPSEITYSIPQGYKTFASAAGLGAPRPEEAVIFKVFVDGKEKFKSAVYSIGQPVLPVVVNISSAKELKLVIEDPAGKISAYAWWGEARLLR